jgi:hypothetical protein
MAVEPVHEASAVCNLFPFEYMLDTYFKMIAVCFFPAYKLLLPFVEINISIKK